MLEMADVAWRTLMAGFTTIQSVGDASEGPLRDALRDGDFPGPRLLTSLAQITGDLTTATPQQLRAMVRERQAQGADLIKIFASSSQRVGAKPTIHEEQLKVLCDEARAVGLRAMVHAYRGQVAAAARAGCREIEHATYATPEELAVAVQAGAYITPQVGLVVQNYLENQARYIGIDGYTAEGMEIMRRDMPEDIKVCRRLVQLGARMVFGTDATAGAHGHNAEEFIGRVQECGQSAMAAMVSANSLAAEALGMGDQLGRLAPGYAADIIALDGDPLQDITAVRRVVFVMRGGKVYKWAGSSREHRSADP
jgi:imidazolonepropionase-like amidohydrolase